MIPVITIDGPSGAGKGTVTRLVAEKLGWHQLDSGALYRILGLACERAGLVPEDAPQAVADLATQIEIEFKSGKVYLNQEDVSGLIRTEEAGSWASRVAAIQAVRDVLLDVQKNFRKAPGLVADGRDMGTVVFADSPVKVFLAASAEERAKRRVLQLQEAGKPAKFDGIYADILARDERDQNRAAAPLIPAEDAQVIDSTEYSIEEVLELILQQVKQAELI